MKIHAKMIDSLSVSVTPSSVSKYRSFVESFSKNVFNKKITRDIDFIGRKFRQLYDRDVRNGISIKLTDDLITIVLTRKLSDSRKLILVTLHQPEAWKNPYQKIKKLEEDLKLHLGDLKLEVERIDVAVHFSGWKIDEELLNSLVKKAKGKSLYDDNQGNVETLGVGSLRSDSVFMRLYNKTKYLKDHPSKASPISFYQYKPFWGRDVWNLEFSFGGDFLRNDFELKNVAEVFEAIPSLWKWATEEYVFVLNEARQDVHDNWKVLSQEISRSNGRCFKRVSRKKTDPNFEFRKDQFLKKAKSFANAMKLETNLDSIEALKKLIEKI